MMRKSMQCVAALALVTLVSGTAWADFSLTFQGLVQTLNTGSDIYLSSPAGIVVDPAADVFVVNTGHNCIVEVTAQGVPSILTITGLSTALLGPSSIAIDGSGKLYIADTGNNRIVTVASGSTTGLVQTILGGVTLSNPTAVTVDRMGNVLVADAGNNRIAEIDTSDNGTVLYTNSVTLSAPLSVALDVFGTVYVADTGNSRGVIVDNPVNGDLAPGDQTYSINKTAVGFGHVQLGSANAVTLTLPFTTGETALGSSTSSPATKPTSLQHGVHGYLRRPVAINDPEAHGPIRTKPDKRSQIRS
jgi:DNA-binding beta-propeller fold protein YncE